MTFIFLTQYYPPEIGAPQTRLASVVRVLRAKGHDVQVITAMPNHLIGKTFDRYRGRLLMRERWNGASLIRVAMYAATGMGPKRLLSYLSFAATSVLGLALARRADCIFIESPPLFLSLPGIAFARLRGMKAIFNVADLWPDSVRQLGSFASPKMLAAAERLERWSYRASDAVCAVSEGITRTLVDEKNVPAAKVVFFPNGVDTQLFSPRPPDPELRARFGADKHVLLYAGTHGAAQGLEIIVEAATLLRDTPAYFVLVGDGHTKPKLQVMVKERKLENVIFIDSQPLEMMPLYFSVALASIVPLIKRDLFRDARPSKMFPSFASGVPVIFSGEGESAALLVENGAGVVAPPEDATALAAAIRTLMADSQSRAEMGRRARELACAQFGWDAIVDRWLKALGVALSA